MAATAGQRSLYRHFLRSLYTIARPTPNRVNLVRLLRPQVRDVLHQVDLEVARAASELLATSRLDETDPDHPAVDRTLGLLASSPHLLKNLSSLAYHHHPHFLAHTNNARRQVGQPVTFKWDTQAPEAARKAAEAESRRQRKDPSSGYGDKALAGVLACMRRAEQEHGVMLGRTERAPRWPWTS